MGSLTSRCLGLHGAIPPPEGPYRHVGVLRLRIPGSTYAQIFYPAKPEGAATFGWPQVQYFRPDAVKGLSRFTGAPAFLMRNLANVEHPFLLNAEVATAADEDPADFPFVLFSHGLGGSAEMYSKVCADMASLGYVVVALEHEDGTASYATPQGESTPIPYRGAPKGFEYQRDNVIEFRGPYLQHRMEEVSAALEFMRKGKATDVKLEPRCDAARLEAVLARTDRSTFWLSGHSFGGTSTTFASREPWAADAQGFVLLDVWPFPIPRDLVAQGFSKPVLSILSDEFVSGREVGITYDLLANSSSPDTHSFYVPGTRHQQFSDFAFAMRGFMLRVAKICGTTGPAESQRAIFAALAGFLSRENGAYDASAWPKDALRTTALEPTPESASD